ncbi:MAG: DNA cytosine methyltransferase [Actinomycetota bacterium]
MSGSVLPLLSLFTGAGGLDVGLEVAGFTPILCVESDSDCRETLKRNRSHWKLAEPGDVHQLTSSALLRQAGLKPRQLLLLSAGPPCQPFSKSAYWSNGNGKPLRDPRSRTLNAFLGVVEAMLPRVLVLENVKGLSYVGKDGGVKLLMQGLADINRSHRTKYSPQFIHLNAADYGVPQKRERIFMVASIDGRTLEFPAPSHGITQDVEPLRTSWDAIGDLDANEWPDELNPAGRWADLLPSIPEGKNYLWHTPRNARNGGEPLFGWRTRYWSFLLKLSKRLPAWTIQAAPGPATGPFHWRNRLLSIEELCRVQTFPKGYEVSGNRRSAHRQIGNAVPCALAELFGLEIRRQLLDESRVPRSLRLVPARRGVAPRASSKKPVPSKYLSLRASHRDHPGPGKGPGAFKEF